MASFSEIQDYLHKALFILNGMRTPGKLQQLVTISIKNKTGGKLLFSLPFQVSV